MPEPDTFHLSHALSGVEPVWRAALENMRAETDRLARYRHRPHPLQVQRYPGPLDAGSANKAVRALRGNHVLAQTLTGAVIFPTMTMSLEDVRDFAATLTGGERSVLHLLPDPAGTSPANATGLSALVSQRLLADLGLYRDLPVSSDGWTRVGRLGHTVERHLSVQLRRGFTLWDLSPTPRAGRVRMNIEATERLSQQTPGGTPSPPTAGANGGLQKLEEAEAPGIEVRRGRRHMQLFGSRHADTGGYLYVAGDGDLLDGTGPWKVGITRVCPEQRVRTGSGSPSFLGRKAELILAIALPAAAVDQVEQITHQTLATLRLRDPSGIAKEWFQATLPTVLDAIGLTLVAGPGDTRDMAFCDASKGVCFPIDRPEWHAIENRLRSRTSLQIGSTLSAPSPLHISMAERAWDAISDAGGDTLLGEDPERIVYALGIMNILSRGLLIPAPSHMDPASDPEIRAVIEHGALTLSISVAGAEPQEIRLTREGTECVFGPAADQIMGWSDGFTTGLSAGSVRFSRAGAGGTSFLLNLEDVLAAQLAKVRTAACPEVFAAPLPS